MTSTIQECVMLNRGTVDKWTIREQLCLASAVSCSGDQNWVSVSRSLKHLCGDGTVMRPIDWFSEKNCAVQYGVLVENLETPECKKLSYDSSSRVSPPVAEDTSSELIRRLNEERQQELKAEMRKEQEEFAQIFKELKALQSGILNEEQLREMWCDIELQQEQERVEEMKFENQMREREQQKPEMQCNWRKLSPVKTNSVLTVQRTNDTTSVDMDVEDLTGASNNEQISTSFNQTKQKQQSAQTGISPLLSSLLKSPTPGTSSPTTISTNTSASSANNCARSSAPTITTLLTCGSIPNKNQPAITLKSSIPPQKAAQLLSSPISGPPSITSVPVTSITGQNLLSPSQAAPTLSMLLERNKTLAITVTNTETRNAEIPKTGLDRVDQSQINENPNEVSDSNNDEVPMELDEDITTHLSDCNENRNNEHDSDEPDPNEEQQLLEVFKNIGNIDELDIDVSAVIDGEEVDFLKDMGADSPNDMRHVEDFENKEVTSVSKITNVLENTVEDDTRNNELNIVDDEEISAKEVISRVEETNPTIKNVETNQRKIETTSSDDSNDNIPLAAVASLEQRAVNEKVVFKEKVASEIKNLYQEDGIESSKKSDAQEIKTLQATFEEGNKEHDKLEQQLADLVGENDGDDTKNFNEDEKSAAASECSDVIVIPTDDDDSNGQRDKQRVDKSKVDEEAEKIKKELENDVVTPEGAKDSAEHEEELPEVSSNIPRTDQKVNGPIAPTISIADTDEESSTTDISFVNRKDDNITSNKQSAVQARRSLIDQNRQDQQSKTDDECTTQFSSSSSSSVAPARPPMLRKLRDRDRSESPMIDGEVHPSNNNASASTLDNFGSQRLRRRYSSTPINDSVPNSPASSDRDREEPETRVSKKSLLSIFHALQYSKNANVLQRSFNEDVQFNEICLRPIDMVSIRKCIESGTIRNVSELQRDIMLMCQNGLMLFKQDTSGFNAANAFMLECQAMREFVANTGITDTNVPVKDNKEGNKSLNMSGTSSKSRSGSRKSQRIS
ncbi:bromodomain-containing protein 8 [Zeugodacus cucurbitae]|uniref:bromodomain-containing protein 8 n=1 Tax=Zeugodacus cucurbitae TaxID=28588 RepID=UPI0005968E56|nr:bromodomain-containing protein 8 [Zeugodacus cucurbitae]